MSLNYQDNTTLFVTPLFFDDYLYVRCLDELSLEYGLKLVFWSESIHTKYFRTEHASMADH